jgi:hypothetical protein
MQLLSRRVVQDVVNVAPELLHEQVHLLQLLRARVQQPNAVSVHLSAQRELGEGQQVEPQTLQVVQVLDEGKEATFVSISWSFSPRELKLYMLMSWQVFIATERVFRQSISVATSCTEFVT